MTTVGSISDIIGIIRGRRVYFKDLTINNGDELIEMGARHFLSNAEVTYVPDPREACAIIINGGGWLGVEIWNENFSLLRQFAQDYRDKTIIIFPSSFYFQNYDFPSLFRGRTAPCYLYARDHYSLEMIQNYNYPSDVQIGIDHDMAWQLRETEFIKNLKTKASKKHFLIVERFDLENSTRQPLIMRIPIKLRRTIPDPWRRMLREKILLRAVDKTKFVQSTMQWIYQQYPNLVGIPVYTKDISNEYDFTFEQFIDYIVDAALIVTTRLHVGFLAAMLGKTTFLKAKKGGYNKIEGCYYYTLSKLKNVNLIN